MEEPAWLAVPTGLPMMNLLAISNLVQQMTSDQRLVVHKSNPTALRIEPIRQRVVDAVRLKGPTSCFGERIRRDNMDAERIVLGALGEAFGLKLLQASGVTASDGTMPVTREWFEDIVARIQRAHDRQDSFPAYLKDVFSGRLGPESKQKSFSVCLPRQENRYAWSRTFLPTTGGQCIEVESAANAFRTVIEYGMACTDHQALAASSRARPQAR
jgi:hypothetical protein